MFRGASRIVDVVLVVAALSTTGLIWKRSLAPAESGPAPIRIKDAATELAFSRRVGPLNAPFRLAVYTDYQCPACRQMEAEVAKLRARLGDSLAVVYRYYPLPIHTLAFDAAAVAECSNRHGAFIRMHDALFSLRLKGDSLPLDTLAKISGVMSREELRQCIARPDVRAVVQNELNQSNAYGFNGTPLVLIGDKMRLGGLPAEQLEPMLRSAAR